MTYDVQVQEMWMDEQVVVGLLQEVRCFVQMTPRTMVVERFGNSIVKADGISPWATERVLLYEVFPGFWTNCMTALTWPG